MDHALAAPSLPALDRQRAVNALLGRMGWEVTSVEIDVDAETARLEIKGNGLLLTLDARRGKATLTRERAEHYTTVFGRRGDRSPVERLRYAFLGRHIVGEGFRSGMRGLANYLDDNGTGPRLARTALVALLP